MKNIKRAQGHTFYATLCCYEMPKLLFSYFCLRSPEKEVIENQQFNKPPSGGLGVKIIGYLGEATFWSGPSFCLLSFSFIFQRWNAEKIVAPAV